MQIRSFTQNDIEDCGKLLMQSYNQPPWRHQWKLDLAVKYLSEYTDCKSFIGFVLCVDENIAGALFAHSKTWWTNDQLFIDELFISPEIQGRGYGKSMLDFAEKFAKENGLDSISLMTNKFMPAFNFYNKINYLQAEQFVFMFKPV